MTQSEANLPDFNRRGEDKMALGHTPSTRSAELVAGARAILLNTDETNALSKMSGRIVSRFLTDIDRKSNVLWFFPARMLAIEELTSRYLPEDKPGMLLIDLAAGFSPRALNLAKQYPQAQVIEIDLPDVVEEKKKRLEKGKISIPDNLSWIPADLGTHNLHDVLDGRKADLITSEGLTLYLTQEENMRLFRQAEDSLKPGGLLMVEIYLKDKLQRLRQNPNVNTVASFVFRMVGSVPGIMDSMDTAIKLLTDARLDQIKAYPVADLMGELEQPKPVDLISIVVARKPAAETVGNAPSQAAAQPETSTANTAETIETTAAQVGEKPESKTSDTESVP